MKPINTLKILFVAALLLLPTWSFAKSQVKASTIIEQINAGKAVQYKDAEIVGDLNFTSIKDTTVDEKSQRNRGRNKGSTLIYWSHVKSPVSFINCVFKGDVLAYVHDDDENETYNTIFYKDVDFQGCDFQGKSAFKYVKFKTKANFKNTKYSHEALFKYTEFSTDVSFSNSHFNRDANFKYTEFPESADYAKTTFRRLANFKYAEFPEGVTFKDAVFKGEALFKYTKFHEPVNFDGTVFDGDVNFKYTKIDGKSFTTYLLKRKDK